MPIPKMRCPGCGWILDASPHLGYRDRQLPESHLALHLSARKNCLGEFRDLGRVEWLLVEPLLEFRRCKTIGGINREGFTKYRNTLTPGEADRAASSALESAARNFAGGKDDVKCKDADGEEVEAGVPFAPQKINPRPPGSPGRKLEELPEGYLRVDGVIGRMVEVGMSGLLLAAGGTVRPVKVRDEWRIGFVDAKRGGDRWSGLFESEAEVLSQIGDVRAAGSRRADELRLHVGGLRNGGWRGND